MTLPQPNPGTSPAPRSSSLSSQSFAPPTITQADAKPLQRPAPTPSEREAIANEILGTPDKPIETASSSLLTSQSLFAAIAIAAGVALLAWTAWHGTRRARRGAIRAQKPAVATDAVVRPAAPDPRAAELLAAAQNIAQQLDARAAQLERTLQVANARIAQLEQVGAAAASGARVSAAPQASQNTPQRARSGAPAAGASELREAKPREAAGGQSAGFSASHRDIYELADQGMTPVQIAQKLSKPTGQIELILNLRKAAHASAS